MPFLHFSFKILKLNIKKSLKCSITNYVSEEYGIIFLFSFVLPFENRILNLFSNMEFLTFIKFIKFLAIQTPY